MFTTSTLRSDMGPLPLETRLSLDSFFNLVAVIGILIGEKVVKTWLYISDSNNL